jgi:branched-chain amino acid transport system permease protein
LSSIVGGAGTLWGPVIGGLLLIPVAEVGNAQFAGTLTGVDVVLYSIVLIVTAMYLPRGLVFLPEFLHEKRKVMQRMKVPPQPVH